MDSTPANPPQQARSSLGFWVMLAVLAAAVMFYMNVIAPRVRQGSRGKHLAVGQRLDYLALAPLTEDATPVELSDVKGKIVLLNFWGTWCYPCVQEFPQLAALAAKYHDRDDFRLLAVACPQNLANRDVEALRADVLQFLSGRSATVPIHADKRYGTLKSVAVVGRLEQISFPLTLVLDRKGIIRAFWEGVPPGGVPEIQTVVRGLLEE